LLSGAPLALLILIGTIGITVGMIGTGAYHAGEISGEMLGT
jgi:hypothetical protein